MHYLASVKNMQIVKLIAIPSITTFIVLALTLVACDHKIDQSFVSSDIEMLFNKSTPDANETHRLGTEVLKIATTSREHSYGFSLLADGFYKKEEYSKALTFYKKVDSISILLDDNNRRFMNNLLMIRIYNKVGLLSKADESLNFCKSIAKKSFIPYSQYYLSISEASLLEMKHDNCKAIPVRLGLLDQITNFSENEDPDKSFLVLSYIKVAYNYIKCGQLSRANIFINEADKLFERDDKIGATIITAFYKMVKGMYAFETGDFTKARTYFDEALDNAQKNNLKEEKQHILQERINCNFDNPAKRKIILQEFNNLEISRKKQLSQIIEGEVKYKNAIIRIKDRNQTILFSLLIILIIIFMIRYFALTKKTDQDKFSKLLLTVPDRSYEGTNSISPKSINETLDNISVTPNAKKRRSSKKLISEEKELDLVSKLESFEKGKDFLSKNFSISVMATQFETNSKYINYILHKHRGKSFSDYINSLRIQYITKLLQEKQNFRNFKISYLSELCGYSSHSRFTAVFKYETGFSPSEFINKIAEK